MKKEKKVNIPTIEEITRERKRLRRGVHYRGALKGTVSVLIVVAAISVLIATLILPILQISGDSMTPTFSDGEIVLLQKSSKCDRGDVIGFYYQGKVLLKRVIAKAGDTVVINDDGDVFVNGEMLIEDYISEKHLGECDIEFPYTVPADSYFVMGDKRDNSVDSRNSAIGSVGSEKIIGRVFFRIWHLDKIRFF